MSGVAAGPQLVFVDRATLFRLARIARHLGPQNGNCEPSSFRGIDL